MARKLRYPMKLFISGVGYKDGNQIVGPEGSGEFCCIAFIGFDAVAGAGRDERER